MAAFAKEGKRMSKTNKPLPTLAALAGRAEQLRIEIDETLDRIVAGDRKSCPNLPEEVIRGLRTARFCHGYCPCAWLKAEHEQGRPYERASRL
jgi:hypothetical protein